jgi:hypothetical protein
MHTRYAVSRGGLGRCGQEAERVDGPQVRDALVVSIEGIGTPVSTINRNTLDRVHLLVRHSLDHLLRFLLEN